MLLLLLLQLVARRRRGLMSFPHWQLFGFAWLLLLLLLRLLIRALLQFAWGGWADER